MSSRLTLHSTSSEESTTIGLVSSLNRLRRSLTLTIFAYVDEHVRRRIVHAAIVLVYPTEIPVHGIARCHPSNDIVVEFQPLEMTNTSVGIQTGTQFVSARYLFVQVGIDERDVVTTGIVSTVHQDGQQLVRARRAARFLQEFTQIQSIVERITIVDLSMLREIVIVFEA